MKILIDGQTLETEEINRGIGNYFKNVVNNLLKIDFTNEWYISVSNEKYLNNLDPWVREKVNIVSHNNLSPQNIRNSINEANINYTNELKKIINENSIDLYWNVNPLMNNVMFPTSDVGCKTFITIYDIIPLVFKDNYLNNWSNDIKEEYLRRLKYINSPDNTIIYLSESARNDFETYVGNNYKKAHVIFAAADSKKYFDRTNLKADNKNNYNILYVGGFDFRKNMTSAIKAFSMAKKKYKNTLFDKARFDIVCSMNDEQKNEFSRILEKNNITDCVKLNGFISETELVRKYKESDVFFFPSLYEGFGLPIVEALLSGTIVVSADNSSLKEVGGDYSIYCNAKDINDMAEKLMEGLKISASETIEKKIERKNYALNFSWDKTSQYILEAFNYEDESNNCINKKKLSIVTPWLPQKTGIAKWIFKLVEKLKVYFEIDIYIDNSVEKSKSYEHIEGVGIYNAKDFKNNSVQYDKIIYQLGNNSDYHSLIYKLALEIPGIIEIHDYNISPFMYHSYFNKKDRHIFKDAIEFYGDEGKKEYEALCQGAAYANLNDFPMIDYIVSKSKGVIVHSYWVKKQLKNSQNVVTIPLPAFDNNVYSKENNFRDKFNIKKDEFLISCLGFINKNKRPYKVIDSVKMLIDNGYPCKLLFLGSGEEKSEILDYANKKNIGDRIIITDFIDDDMYHAGIYESDVIVNLRYPSMGESSATLTETFKMGKAVLVSNINQYKEFPDEVCWKVDVNSESEINQLYSYISYLLKNPDVRFVLGKNAQNYANSVLDVNYICKLYNEFITGNS